ncbi:MAG: hypothetical protein KME57_19935 [Scytonema hyalinum WJT4-NPBG1]|nr:hypothetical protein [Scytonema hyalinum WJT4-NPBG1]
MTHSPAAPPTVLAEVSPEHPLVTAKETTSRGKIVPLQNNCLIVIQLHSRTTSTAPSVSLKQHRAIIKYQSPVHQSRYRLILEECHSRKPKAR